MKRRIFLVCLFYCFFRLPIYESIAAIFWQSASYVYYVNTLTILRKIAILAETGKMEGKLATLVRKSVLILAAKYKYKLYNLFLARLVSRICSIYVSIFRTQCNSISHIVSN